MIKLIIIHLKKFSSKFELCKWSLEIILGILSILLHTKDEVMYLFATKSLTANYLEHMEFSHRLFENHQRVKSCKTLTVGQFLRHLV